MRGSGGCGGLWKSLAAADGLDFAQLGVGYVATIQYVLIQQYNTIRIIQQYSKIRRVLSYPADKEQGVATTPAEERV